MRRNRCSNSCYNLPATWNCKRDPFFPPVLSFVRVFRDRRNSQGHLVFATVHLAKASTSRLFLGTLPLTVQLPLWVLGSFLAGFPQSLPRLSPVGLLGPLSRQSQEQSPFCSLVGKDQEPSSVIVGGAVGSGSGHGEWEGPWRVTSAQLCQLLPKGRAQEATWRCLGANHSVLS